MENLKIRVNNEAESKEAQGLFFELGYKWFSGGNQVQHLKQSCSASFGYLVAWSSGCFTDVIQCGCGNEDAKEITLPQLRDLVVLKRDDVNDEQSINDQYAEIENVREKHSHYKKDVSHLDVLDIYRVTELFKPHSCGAHIAKKALCSGERGHKDLLTDIQDIIDTAERWKEMLIEDSK